MKCEGEMMQKCIPKVFGLGRERWVGIFVYKYLVVQILQQKITLQYSRVPQLPSTQSSVWWTLHSPALKQI